MENKSNFKSKWKDRKRSIAFIICIALLSVTVLGSIPSMAGGADEMGSKAAKTSSPGALESDLMDSGLSTSSGGSLGTTSDSGIDDSSKSVTPSLNSGKLRSLEESADGDVGSEKTSIFIREFNDDKNGAVITAIQEKGLDEGTTTLAIPESLVIDGKEYPVTEIGNSAFKTLVNCDVNKIVFPSTLTTIGEQAFMGVEKITSLDFTKATSLNTIKDNAFRNLKNLTTLDLSSTPIVNIYGQAFWNCEKLESINLPNTLKHLGQAFGNSKSLKSIALPKGLTHLGGGHSGGCFANSGIKSITIPGGVEHIEVQTFLGSKLEEVVLSDGVKYIDEAAFESGFAEGATIKIPSSLETIGANAFRNMSNGTIDLTSFTPGAITGSPWAADDTTEILWKDMDDSCYWIDEQGYIVGIKPEGHGEDKCKDTNYHGEEISLVVPESVMVNGIKTIIKGIAPYTFQNNTKIASVKFANNSQIKEIGKYSFDNCSNLTEIVLPDNLKIIGENAFARSKINKIVLPESLTAIKEGAFSESSELNIVEFPSNNGSLTTIGGSAFKSTPIVNLQIPNTVTEIGDTAFLFCFDLEKIVLSNQLKSIAKLTFAYAGTKCEQITIPASVKTIDSRAFEKTGIKTINILGSEMNLSKNKDSFNSDNIKALNFLNIDKHVNGDSVTADVTDIKDEPWGANYATITYKNMEEPAYMLSDGVWEFHRKEGYINSFTPTPSSVKGGVFTAESLTVPSTITVGGIAYKVNSVKGGAVQGKLNVDELIISEGFVGLGDQCFAWCSEKGGGIKKVILPKSLKTIDASFMYSGVGEVVFAEDSDLETIGRYAFVGGEMTSVDIPSSVKSIGASAFYKQNLQGDIYIGSNCTAIDANAFLDNPSITAIYIDNFRKDVPNISGNGRLGLPDGVPIIFKGQAPTIITNAIEKVGPNDTEIGRNITLGIKYEDEEVYLDAAKALSPEKDVKSNEYNEVDRTLDYVVYKNGTYKFDITSNLNYTTTYAVVIDDIGKMNITGNSVEYPVLEAGTFTKEQIIKSAKMEALDVDSKSTDLDFVISDEDHAAVNKMENAGNNVDITVTAIYNGTYPNDAMEDAGKPYQNKISTTINVKLTAVPAKISFHGNGGTPELTERAISITHVSGAALGAANMHEDPTRVGHDFVGWTVSGSAAAFDPDAKIKQDVDVIANWEVHIHELSFDVNGGDSETPTTQSIAYGTTAEAVDIPTRAGYDFVGWNMEQDGSGDNWNFQTTTMPDNNVKLYAQWKIKIHNVVFNLNGAPGQTPDTQHVTYGALATEPTDQFTRTGYIFDGWYTEKVDPASAFDQSKKYNFASEVRNDMTLYAGWKTYEYTVNYDVNAEGVDAIEAMKVISPDTTIKALPTDPKHETQTFKGWNTNKDGSGKAFDASYVITEDITVYAQWTGGTVAGETGGSVDGGEGSTGTVRSATANDGSVNGEGASGNVLGQAAAPSVKIGNTEVPLYGNQNATWALINLILAVAGAVIAAMILIRSIYRKFSKDKNEDNEANYDDENRYEEEKKTRPIWYIVTFVMAVLGAVIFIITQDMSLDMVMVDNWTIVNAIIFAIEVVASVFIFRTKEKENEEFNTPSFQ